MAQIKWASSIAADCLVRPQWAAPGNVTPLPRCCWHQSVPQSSCHTPSMHLSLEEQQEQTRGQHGKAPNHFVFICVSNCTSNCHRVLLISEDAEGEQKHNHCLINCTVAMTTGCYPALHCSTKLCRHKHTRQVACLLYCSRLVWCRTVLWNLISWESK